MRPAARLAERLGLPVSDLDIVEQALVHSSYLHEHPSDARAHNERLEYLGDSVINLVISEALYLRHPTDDEGTLSARRAAIVSTVGLARLAGRIDLGEALLLGEGEAARSGRRRPSLLASGLEALAGALYLDLGYAPTRDWLLALAAPEVTADLPLGTLKSPKSRLQELTQREAGTRPVYRIVDASGPDHARFYRIEVSVRDRVLGSGEGASRRVAETSAAAAALEALAAEDARIAAGLGLGEGARDPAASAASATGDGARDPAAPAASATGEGAAAGAPTTLGKAAGPTATSGFGEAAAETSARGEGAGDPAAS